MRWRIIHLWVWGKRNRHMWGTWNRLQDRREKYEYMSYLLKKKSYVGFSCLWWHSVYGKDKSEFKIRGKRQEETTPHSFRRMHCISQIMNKRGTMIYVLKVNGILKTFFIFITTCLQIYSSAFFGIVLYLSIKTTSKFNKFI